MDGQTCDKHPSAWAKARVLFPNLCLLYFCSHCLDAFAKNYHGDYHVTYETVSLNA